MRMRILAPVVFLSVLVVAWWGSCSGSSDSSTVGKPDSGEDKRREQEAGGMKATEAERPELTERERQTERLKREYGYAQWPKKQDARLYPFEARGFRDTVHELGRVFACEVSLTQSFAASEGRGSASATLKGLWTTITVNVRQHQEAAKEYLIQYLTAITPLPWNLRHGTPPTFEVGDVMVDEGDRLSLIRHNVAVVIQMSSGNGKWPLTHEQLVDIAKKIDEMILREAEPIRKPRE